MHGSGLPKLSKGLWVKADKCTQHTQRTTACVCMFMLMSQELLMQSACAITKFAQQ